jgi:hypothetical protein
MSGARVAKVAHASSLSWLLPPTTPTAAAAA